MKVLFFAQCREATGRDQYDLEVATSISSADLWTLLIAGCPALAPFQKTARLARNDAYLQSDEFLHPDDEVAIIPPVSGG